MSVNVTPNLCAWEADSGELSLLCWLCPLVQHERFLREGNQVMWACCKNVLAWWLKNVSSATQILFRCRHTLCFCAQARWVRNGTMATVRIKCSVLCNSWALLGWWVVQTPQPTNRPIPGIEQQLVGLVVVFLNSISRKWEHKWQSTSAGRPQLLVSYGWDAGVFLLLLLSWQSSVSLPALCLGIPIFFLSHVECWLLLHSEALE